MPCERNGRTGRSCPPGSRSGQLAFVCRWGAEKERRKAQTRTPAQTGVRLPLEGGKGTPVGSGGSRCGVRYSEVGERGRLLAGSGGCDLDVEAGVGGPQGGFDVGRGAAPGEEEAEVAVALRQGLDGPAGQDRDL